MEILNGISHEGEGVSRAINVFWKMWNEELSKSWLELYLSIFFSKPSKNLYGSEIVTRRMAVQWNCSVLNWPHSLIYSGIRRHKNDRKSVHDIDRTADDIDIQSLSPFKDILWGIRYFASYISFNTEDGKGKTRIALWCGGGVLGYVFGFVSSVFVIPKWTSPVCKKLTCRKSTTEQSWPISSCLDNGTVEVQYDQKEKPTFSISSSSLCWFHSFT